MSSNRLLVQLAKTIADNTSVIDAYIVEEGLPEPSYDETCPPLLDLPPDLRAKHAETIDALEELHFHLNGPLPEIMDTMMQFWTPWIMYALVHFKILDKLPIGSSMRIEELAQATDMARDDVALIVRVALPRHLLIQKEDGKVAHSAATKAIKCVPHVTSCLQYLAKEVWTRLPYFTGAIEKWPGAQELNQTALNLMEKTDADFWERVAQDPESIEIFAGLMKFFHNSPALSPRFVLEYDWSRHEKGKVVDMGGSHGTVALTLANEFPDMQIVVQDRIEVVATAPQNANANVTFQVHDLFEPQPIKDADVYFMRWILHDWPDKYAIKILRAIAPALRPGSRIVIMEILVPEHGVLKPHQERLIGNVDISMKLLCNALERTEDQWRELVEEALGKSKIRIEKGIRPEGSQLQLLIIEWTG